MSSTLAPRDGDSLPPQRSAQVRACRSWHGLGPGGGRVRSVSPRATPSPRPSVLSGGRCSYYKTGWAQSSPICRRVSGNFRLSAHRTTSYNQCWHIITDVSHASTPMENPADIGLLWHLPRQGLTNEIEGSCRYILGGLGFVRMNEQQPWLDGAGQSVIKIDGGIKIDQHSKESSIDISVLV